MPHTNNSSIGLDDNDTFVPFSHSEEIKLDGKSAEMFPQYEETSILEALKDSTKFQELIKYHWDLSEIAKQFPQHAKALATRVLEDDIEFKRLIIERDHFLKIAQIIFPDEEELIKWFVSTPENFKRFCPFIIDSYVNLQVQDTGESLSHYAKSLIEMFVNTPEEFKRIFQNLYVLCETAERLQENGEVLFSGVLKNPEVFRHLIIDAEGSLSNLMNKYPKYMEILMTGLLKDANEFQRFIKDKEAFRKIEDLFFSFPNYLEMLIKLLISTTEDFKILSPIIMSQYNDIGGLAISPEYTKKLMFYIFKDAEEFQRLINNEDGLKEMATSFPQYAEVFQKSSVKEAAEAAKMYILKKQSEVEISKNARLVAQASRTYTGPSFFRDLPVELALHILSFTGKHEVYDEKTVGEVINNNLVWPPLKP